MTKYMVLYKAPKGAMEKMANATPEEMKKGMEPWMAWAAKCGAHLVDLGLPLGNAHRMTSKEHGLANTTVAGYSIIQAASWEEVRKLLEGHPHLSWVEGAELEIHEMLPMPGM